MAKAVAETRAGEVWSQPDHCCTRHIRVSDPVCVHRCDSAPSDSASRVHAYSQVARTIRSAIRTTFFCRSCSSTMTTISVLKRPGRSRMRSTSELWWVAECNRDRFRRLGFRGVRLQPDDASPMDLPVRGADSARRESSRRSCYDAPAASRGDFSDSHRGMHRPC